ncbi:HDOD domain-containing protein [Desulfofustis glycolicus]|uniref:HDIG domain-containing protein n=1 Tax=Desulfofustis glycolicus DSM 9705 TaxID=1121409 RepID=A0A1M5V917_9BACT|nr:HDOD domain-containing protein [Desulfofustis glycolicus]MCB2214889.1 HDOD domain-containing protein [Desulfobulbaceae bacterium]SHH71762.1 HDIG domain-containing protein [Desulfofustis glycolicus DSM 9705]
MTAAQELIASYRSFKTLPHVVTKLSQLINDSNTTMKDFEEVIKMDPTLVVRLLRLVNSPYYGLSQYIESIGRAVALIGMKNLYNIAVTDALKHLFREREVSRIFSRQKLWLHCAAVAICSQMLAERVFGINGDDAYLCGILHDFGLIVEEQAAGAVFYDICRAALEHGSLPEQERKRLTTDHAEIGYLITDDWGIPHTIREAIRDHHSLRDAIEPTSLTGILQIAEYLTGQLGYTILAIPVTELSPVLADHIQDNIDEYRVLLDDLPAEMSKASEIYRSTEH